MHSLFGSSERPHEESKLRGLGASGGVYEGPARRVAGPAEFDRIIQGDVLLTESTTEAFNILLPLLGAIVTDSGGLLSHSAIVAREYGIPGVVGTRDGTGRISDGARVASRRRRGRSDGPWMTGVVALIEAHDDSHIRLQGGRARSGGAGRAAAAAGVALSGAIVEAVAVAMRTLWRRSPRRLRRCPARSPFARRRSTRTGRKRASPANT